MLNEKAISQNKIKLFWNKLLKCKEIKKYKKFGEVKARLARDGEKINTIIKGEKETETVTELGDVVITGVSNERYIISIDDFKKRYDGMPLLKSNQLYDAKGITFAGEWRFGDMDFINSSDEEMIINDGDYISSPTLQAAGKLYRIEKSVFPKTYQ